MSRYWCLELCGWVDAPGAPDALGTPWSAHEVRPLAPQRSGSGYDVLGLPLPAVLPVQREAAAAPVDA